jgi:hypothetical protein
LVLHHIRGAKKYEDLRTVQGIVYDTFKEAAIAMGLLEDDREVISCLQEASVIRPGRALRELFALILAINTPAHPAQIWEQFLVPMTEDLLYVRCQVWYSHIVISICFCGCILILFLMFCK